MNDQILIDPEHPLWLNRESATSFSPIPGITMWPMVGQTMMFTFVRLEPGTVLPDHHHQNEQSGAVLEGDLTITIGNETKTLRPGDAYLIPSDVLHGAIAGPAGCLVIDIFCPPRADYVESLRVHMQE